MRASDSCGRQTAKDHEKHKARFATFSSLNLQALIAGMARSYRW